MGTTTPNYTLYKPAVGETGWGPGVNGNFDSVDTALHNLRTDVNAVSASGHSIVFNGTTLTQRAKLKFGAGFNVFDDPANNQTVIEFVGAGIPAGAIYFGGEPIYLASEPVILGG